MNDKSLARLEMELEELKDKKNNLKKPPSTGAPFVILILGLLMLAMGGLWAFLGVITGIVGVLGLINAYSKKAQYNETFQTTEKMISEKRKEIVDIKEKAI